MNADAKKKVDVLSEELLPYIIAEQERRTTLYKRVMTAIQNGEKGVTIAEIRNKPPAIIRKGIMYRCPTNRAPKEPDGSGVIMCEDGIEPSSIMYDSCLSAEDKELYVAENKYFFCNRHKVEGPDLPRNGTTVIGCAPCERTSLNYTSSKCALEDTDDVVVHYRYYPDRTYKFVTELDPDREVCEHWNPCQIGYIFSLPSPDQATPASELWQDTIKEFVKPPLFENSKVTIKIPPGMQYSGVGKYLPIPGGGPRRKNIEVTYKERDDTIQISLKFMPMEPPDIGLYFARFDNISDPKQMPKLIELVDFTEAITDLTPVEIIALPGEKLNQTQINMTCDHCHCKVIMLRADDGSIKNLETSKFRIHRITDTHANLDIDIDQVTFQDYGEYFAHITLADGTEERLKALIIKLLQVTTLRKSATVGQPLHEEVECKCTDCEVTALVCNGDSMLDSHFITVMKRTSLIFSFDIQSFEDLNSCVYMVTFKKGDTSYYNIIAVLEKVTIKDVRVIPPPNEGDQFETEISYECGGECSVDKVMLNGVPLLSNTRRTEVGAIPFYVLGDHKIVYRITKFMQMLVGVQQGVFLVDGEPVTKTLLEIRKPLKTNYTYLTQETVTTEGEEKITESSSTESSPTESAPTESVPTESTSTDPAE
ncbi:unnamed protein product [Arctia plantaginis]|uniref:Uncharacterized protein n=1 Tax=Arctia plantaginis TaxID=874455 RepID=A0A8S1BGS4_ARCPL|nr:unnamed protein product [Arctia plantaginis]